MIRIVKGNETFLNGVFELYKKIKAQFKAENLNIYQQDDYPTIDDFRHDLSDSEGVLIALDDDKVVGYISLENEDYFFNDCFSTSFPKEFLERFDLTSYKGRFISYGRLMVDPLYRNQGIASNLLKLMDKKCDGFMIIFLVDVRNANAQKLYDSLGYQNIGQYDLSFGAFYVYIKNQLK